MDIQAINADLQVLADKYQVHFKGTATPVSPDVDVFDVTVSPSPAAPVEATPEAPAA